MMNIDNGIENTNEIETQTEQDQQVLEASNVDTVQETLEQAMEATLESGANSNEGVEQATGDAPTEEVPTKDKAEPAYLAFVAATNAHAALLGVSVKEQKGFFQYSSAVNGHKLYVAKQGKGVSRVDTTLPRTALTVNGRDISLPLSKPNGRVTCHIDPSVESVNAALEVLASFSDKIPAPKKPSVKESLETV